MDIPKKVVIIGLDAPIVKSVRRCVEEGKMPNVKNLIENGIWAENCLVPHPTITPPNWTTIVTGSWPGTHGITCFHIHKEGMPLGFETTYQAFNSDDCLSEYLWEALERIGKKSIVINYPTTWPPRMKTGIQLGGFGLHINDWRIDKEGKSLPGWGCLHLLADAQCITTEELPFADTVKLKEVENWKNLPSAKKNLEAEVKVATRNTKIKVKPKTYYLLVQDRNGKGFDTVSLAKSKDGKDILFSLKNGNWSEKVYDEFETEEGKKKAFFMGKLIELSPDGKNLKLYLTQFCHFGGWSYPEDIAGKLENLNGLPLRAMEDPLHFDWIDIETYLELTDMENVWLGEAAVYLMKNIDWSFFAMHAHVPDHTYHYIFKKSDPTKNEKDLEWCQKIEDNFYTSLDRMIGKIVETAGEDTLFIITSDHGAVPTENRTSSDFKHFDVNEILINAGLAVLKEDPLSGEKTIDWKKTKAIAQRSVYIYINLKGRDPDGIVEPGKEYEELREKIINLLYDYTDPKTGKKPIAFALKKEDARILGLYGDRIGDIVYGVHGWVSGEHGRQITTADYGIGSMKGLLIMKGPGIKKGEVLKRTVWLTDIVPTICYLLDWPVPKDTEGSVIYQVFEDHDFKRKEIEKLKKNYERVKSALEGQKALTHTYSEF